MKLGSFLNGSRAGGVAIAFLAFFTLATPDWPDLPPPPPGPAVSSLAATPVAFDLEGRGRSRAGALRFLAGWSLTSDDGRFGGLSALQVEGAWVTAVSDAGSLVRFRLPETTGGEQVLIAPIVEGPPGSSKSDRDAEALLISGSQAWIVFESPRQIWRYDRDRWRAEAGAAPSAMRRWRHDWGAEALVRLGDGRFLVLSEMPAEAPGLLRALLFAGDPALAETAASPLLYRPPEGFRATDAAMLPDGRLLVLNRRAGWLEGVGAALTLIDPRTIRPGAVLVGQEIARLEWPLSLDNMEGLSVTHEGGRAIVWLVSDDNFNPVQRTLLLKFELVE